jgi:hemerythrin-like domain-containing protein
MAEQSVFDVLKREHREIKKLLKTTEKEPGHFQELADELTRHTKAEEKAFYEQIKNEESTHQMVLEGYEEHHVVEMLMKEMKKLKAGTDQWQAKLKVMSENVEHHIEEEEGEMFPEAKKVLGRERAMEIADEFQKAERQLVGATS